MPFKRRSKNLNKSTLTSLQGGERSCACMASYKCGEGVHPVRETISYEFAPNPCHDSIAHLGGGGGGGGIKSVAEGCPPHCLKFFSF